MTYRQYNNQDIQLARELLSPPGDTLLETLDAFEMSQQELAERMDRPAKTINEIIKGKEAITPQTALQLERVLGIPADFWIERERIYRLKLARLDEDEKLLQQANWMKKFPIKAMLNLGWLNPPTHENEPNWVDTLLKFFGVESEQAWRDIYVGGELEASFYRISLHYATDPHALSAWLRQGEREAHQLDLPEYKRQNFKTALLEAREMSQTHPDDFLSRLQNLCRTAGVALVYTPCLPKAPISGVARWIHNGRNPLIQLSGRYKTNDVFWFTFFHEAGHILLHSKKLVFLENVEGAPVSAEQEREANEFAANWLIRQGDWRRFVQKADFSEKSVQRFAERQGVHPATVAGRLEHERLLPHSALRHLKVPVDPGSRSAD